MTPDEREKALKRVVEWSVLVSAAAVLELDRDGKWARESPVFLQGFDTAIKAIRKLAEEAKP